MLAQGDEKNSAVARVVKLLHRHFPAPAASRWRAHHELVPAGSARTSRMTMPPLAICNGEGSMACTEAARLPTPVPAVPGKWEAWAPQSRLTLLAQLPVAAPHPMPARGQEAQRPQIRATAPTRQTAGGPGREGVGRSRPALGAPPPRWSQDHGPWPENARAAPAVRSVAGGGTDPPTRC